MDSACVETNEDEDLSTVVLADKGKGVDPREHGSALYDPKLMNIPAGTTSTGGSDVIELVGFHRDRGKNADQEETSNSMAKHEPYKHMYIALDADEERFLFCQTLFLERFEPTELIDRDGIIGFDFLFDKETNVDREERENGMAKDEPGPSRIDCHDHDDGSIYEPLPSRLDVHYRTGRKKSFSLKPTKLTDLNDGLPYDPTLPQRQWFPKISPYRFTVFSTPLAIGTAKAVLSQKGLGSKTTTPIALEWIYGVVIFLV
jgi:hypothetical protein